MESAMAWCMQPCERRRLSDHGHCHVFVVLEFDRGRSPELMLELSGGKYSEGERMDQHMSRGFGEGVDGRWSRVTMLLHGATEVESLQGKKRIVGVVCSARRKRWSNQAGSGNEGSEISVVISLSGADGTFIV